jgi:hypothetical protein
MEYILGWFNELHLERRDDMLGRPERLSSEKLESWSRLEGIRLTAFELDAIRRLDGLFISKKYDREEPNT